MERLQKGQEYRWLTDSDIGESNYTYKAADHVPSPPDVAGYEEEQIAYVPSQFATSSSQIPMSSSCPLGYSTSNRPMLNQGHRNTSRNNSDWNFYVDDWTTMQASQQRNLHRERPPSFNIPPTVPRGSGCSIESGLYQVGAYHLDERDSITDFPDPKNTYASLFKSGIDTPRSSSGSGSETSFGFDATDTHNEGRKQRYVANRSISHPPREGNMQYFQETGTTLQQADTWSANMCVRDTDASNMHSSPCISQNSSFSLPSSSTTLTGAPRTTEYSSPTSGSSSLLSNPSNSNAGVFRDQDPDANFRDDREGGRHSLHPSDIPKRPSSSKRNSLRSRSKKQWPCTFSDCLQSSKNRYEWERHENTHVPGAWMCMPENTPYLNGHCGICGESDLDSFHFHAHPKLEECLNNSNVRRVFSRRDRLRDHIRAVHLDRHSLSPEPNSSWTASMPWLDEWRREPDMSTADPQALWCGFCETKFDTWTARQDDVGDHLENGTTMDCWKKVLECAF